MSGKTSTSTSGVSIPKEVLARYNAVNTQAQNVAQTPFTQYSQDPNAFVAPLTETQAAGINAVNANAGSTDPYFQGATQTLVGGASAAMPLYEQATGLAGEGGQAVAPGELDIGKYQNPYIDSVVNATLANQRQQQAQEQQGLTSNAITAGAFGGDRTGLARASLAKQQEMATAQTEAGLRSEAFNTGLGAAQQQQGVNLAAEQANRAAKAAEAGQVQGIGKDIYSIGSGVSQGLAGLGAGQQQAALTGAQAQLSAGTAQQQTEQAGLSAMYNQFLQQQGYPFQTTQFLANIAEGTGALAGSDTTTRQPSSFFSDERLKEDIEPIGETYDGQKIYKYRYKGQEGKQIGLVAQDVERKHPDAVGSSQGFKTVDYDAATKDSASMGGGVTADRAGQAFASGGAAEDDGMAQVMSILTQHRQQYPYGNTGLYGIPDIDKYGPFKTTLDTTRRGGPKPERVERHPLNYVINLPDIKDSDQYARGGRTARASGGGANYDYFERVLAAQRAMYGDAEKNGAVGYGIPKDANTQHQLLRPEKIQDPSSTTGGDISSAVSTGKNIADLWSAFKSSGGVAGRGGYADGGSSDSFIGPRLPDDQLTEADRAAQNDAWARDTALGREPAGGYPNDPGTALPSAVLGTAKPVAPTDTVLGVARPPPGVASAIGAALAPAANAVSDAVFRDPWAAARPKPGLANVSGADAARRADEERSRGLGRGSIIAPNLTGNKSSAFKDPSGAWRYDEDTNSPYKNPFVRNSAESGPTAPVASGLAATIRPQDAAQRAGGAADGRAATNADMTQAVATGAPAATLGSASPTATVPPPAAPEALGNGTPGLGRGVTTAPKDKMEINAAPAGLAPVTSGTVTAPTGGLAPAGGAKDQAKPGMAMESWLVPLLSGLGAMASSPSRYLGAAILQGAAGAASGYETVQKNIAERGKTGAETMLTQSIIGSDAYDAKTNTVRVYDANNRAVQQPLISYLNDVKAGKAMPVTPAVSGVPTANAAGTPPPAAAPPAPSPAAPIAAAGAVQPISPASQAMALKNAESIISSPGGMTPENINSPTMLATGATPFKTAAEDAAQAARMATPMNELVNALISQQAAGVTTVWAQPALNAVQNVLRVLGFNDVASRINNGTTAVEEIKKLSGQLTGAAGSKSVEELMNTIASFPNEVSTVGGQARLIPDILIQKQMMLDKNEAATAWKDAVAAQYGQGVANVSGQGFDNQFLADHQQRYAEDRRSLEQMFTRDTKSGKLDTFNGIPLPTYLFSAGDKVDPKVREYVTKTYGPGVLHYFGVK